ncbi:lysyl-tRNA synthetase, class 2 [Arboricoccus pini]|uniref:Lysyl-tRNA synthetase, class 2 n=1 Tax=Arboricoccus pini TaxID=1963835 RepID=A0A212QQ31_9PROT|nr:EF-P lysine aminoacylase EpmA [Arboricoccus pini]SNB61589.1 lysyl-tRNA synthetase, class 2 [Arboricoccus pini]
MQQRDEVDRWWQPDRHKDRRPFLLARNRIRRALGAWFEARGFVEVDTACLQVSPGNEAHLHAFKTAHVSTDGQTTRPLYLHTSPEFAVKKLLAAGEQRLFTFAHVFRNREAGYRHSPEFTMLEWYRRETPLAVLMSDCEALLRETLCAAGSDRLAHQGQLLAVDGEFERLSVAEAFARHAGIDLLATCDLEGGVDREALAAEARKAGLRVAPDDSWSDIFSRVIVGRVEPHLGMSRPTILHSYPLAEAALARRDPADPRLAQRFELYALGVELANGFAELTDPVEQRRRFEAEMATKQAVYGETYPLDEDFLAALAIMPEASGIALGFERLVMLATGAQRIDQVLWTPVDC